MSKADLKSGDGKKQTLIIDSDEEDAELRKKPQVEEKLSLVLEELATIKDCLDEVTYLTKHNKIPLGVKHAIRDTFKCLVCHTIPIVPPVIITKCCKTILVFIRTTIRSQCVNEWYSGEEALTKTCPSCRVERGYNKTVILQRLDEFLINIQPAMEEENSSD